MGSIPQQSGIEKQNCPGLQDRPSLSCVLGKGPGESEGGQLAIDIIPRVTTRKEPESFRRSRNWSTNYGW